MMNRSFCNAILGLQLCKPNLVPFVLNVIENSVLFSERTEKLGKSASASYTQKYIQKRLCLKKLDNLQTF